MSATCRYCGEAIMFVADRPLNGNGHWEHGVAEEYPHGFHRFCQTTQASPKRVW